MTEAELQANVVKTAHLFGWTVAHFRSVPVKTNKGIRYMTPVSADGKGFPDLCLVHGEHRRVLFRELKQDGRYPEPEQTRLAGGVCGCRCRCRRLASGAVDRRHDRERTAGHAMTANRDSLALMASLVLEDGRRWGDVAEPWQWRLAEWAFDDRVQPNRWESRPRGGSKSTDTAGLLMVSMLTTLSAGSQLDAYAVDRDQARLIVDWARGIVTRTPALASALTIDAYKITARNGSVFEVMAADAASAYGRKSAVSFLDEFCQWPNTTNARGVWQAVSSAMGKVRGAKLLCATTSGDPGHWSHKIYRAALKSKRWSVQDVPGPLVWVDPDYLAEQRAIFPESVYRRLHLNEWCAPEDRLTNIDDVQACVKHAGILEPQAGRPYVIGVDLGITNDRTVAAVMHAERVVGGDGHNVVQQLVLDRLEVWTPTRANPVDLTAVEEWIALASRQYRARVVIDPYQAVAMTQRLRSKGVSIEEFTFSQQSVGRLAMALHTSIRDHRLGIPDDPELIDELVNVRLRETSPNVYRLDHDPDRHDDRAIAMALAVLHLHDRRWRVLLRLRRGVAQGAGRGAHRTRRDPRRPPLCPQCTRVPLMAISLTKSVTILSAVESVELVQALNLLGFESYNRANGGTLNHLLPVIGKLRETGQARIASASGIALGGMATDAHPAHVTSKAAAEAADISGRGVRYAIEAGRLEGCCQIGRSRMVSVTSLEAFIERRQRRQKRVG